MTDECPPTVRLAAAARSLLKAAKRRLRAGYEVHERDELAALADAAGMPRFAAELRQRAAFVVKPTGATVEHGAHRPPVGRSW